MDLAHRGKTPEAGKDSRSERDTGRQRGPATRPNGLKPQCVDTLATAASSSQQLPNGSPVQRAPSPARKRPLPKGSAELRAPSPTRKQPRLRRVFKY